MSTRDAWEIVLRAAREYAQTREDDADASDEERAETAQIWEAIEAVRNADDRLVAIERVTEPVTIRGHEDGKRSS